MKKISTKKIKGIFSAISVAFFQGFDAIIFSLLALVASLAVVRDNIAFTISVLALKEIIALVIFIAIFVLMSMHKLQMSFRTMRTKPALIVFLSSLFTAIGNTFYILGIVYAGASYGSILIVLYPIFAMLLFKYLLKEKESWIVWVGICVSIFSSILFVSLPILIAPNDFSTIKIIGMVLSAIAAIFWAIEGFVLKKALNLADKMKINLESKEVLLIRNFGASTFTSILLLPLGMIWGNSFEITKDIINNWKSLVIVLALSFNNILLRLYHLYAIKTIGPKLTATIDVNNFLVAPFFAIFLSMIPNLVYYGGEHDGQQIFEIIKWWLWLLIIPILIGAFLVVKFSKSGDIHEPGIT